MIVWALKSQFYRTWSIAWKRKTALDNLINTEELKLSGQYRGAYIGLGLGTISLVVFSMRIGMTPWIGFSFFLIYFLLAITLTRVRAELGTPHEIYFVNPRLILVTIFGTQALGAQSLTLMSVMYWFNRGYRCHPMPNQLEAMKMGETVHLKWKALLWLIVLAFLWGTLVSYWANLHVTFAEGATSKSIGFKRWVGSESYDRVQGWLQTPLKPNTKQLFYTAGEAIAREKQLKGGSRAKKEALINMENPNWEDLWEKWRDM